MLDLPAYELAGRGAGTLALLEILLRLLHGVLVRRPGSLARETPEQGRGHRRPTLSLPPPAGGERTRPGALLSRQGKEAGSVAARPPMVALPAPPCRPKLLSRRWSIMAMGDDDKLEGAWDKVKGRVKKALGELTDDEKTKREGSVDKAKGTLKEIKGDIKRKIDPDTP
jgi:uncharacterized protein YjbJ (UPF0337 family)